MGLFSSRRLVHYKYPSLDQALLLKNFHTQKPPRFNQPDKLPCFDYNLPKQCPPRPHTTRNSERHNKLECTMQFRLLTSLQRAPE
jgi:hypothetical protein